MIKNTKKHHRQSGRSERKHSAERSVAPTRVSRLKDMSKKFLHNYVIPMTRIIENRLLQLERSL